MSSGFTPSEKFVASLCEHSFLRLWTHPNPKGKKGKELCDCLIVCGSHIVIISVKENEYRETGDNVGWDRWRKVALDKSISQILGAERWLHTVDTIERSDGRIISLPNHENRKYHRVAVALGAEGKVPLSWGDNGGGFVHVCNEFSIKALFLALDTITDFVEFLTASEALIAKSTVLLDGAGVEDLVALYLINERSFDISEVRTESPDLLILGGGIWDDLIKSENFKFMQDDFKSSYDWDRLIECFTDDLLTDGMFDMYSNEVTDNELALVTMALQPRGYRAVLAESLVDFMQIKNAKSLARVVQGYANTSFVFMAGSSADRQLRVRELALRCLVVRGRMPNAKTVIGIATDRPGTSNIGYATDFVYIHSAEWGEDNEANVEGIQKELGYFSNVTWKK